MFIGELKRSIGFELSVLFPDYVLTNQLITVFFATDSQISTEQICGNL